MTEQNLGNEAVEKKLACINRKMEYQRMATIPTDVKSFIASEHLPTTAAA